MTLETKSHATAVKVEGEVSKFSNVKRLEVNAEPCAHERF